MISVRMAKSYCCEDISKIENYNLAIADKTQKWHLHHKLGIIENKSKEQLKKEGLYKKRPACELVFLTEIEHRRLHNSGENHPNFGKHPSDDTKEKMSIAKSGENNPNFGKHRSEETKKKIVDAQINDPKTSKPVLQFTKDGEFIAEYPSIKEAYRQTNIDHSNIAKCCRGKAKSAGGYVWKYKSLIIKQ